MRTLLVLAFIVGLASRVQNVQANEVRDFFRSGVLDGSEDEIRVADQGVLFLEGSDSNGKHGARKLKGNARRKAADDSAHVSLEQILLARRDARMLSDVELVSVRSFETAADAPSEAPTEAPVEGPIEGPTESPPEGPAEAPVEFNPDRDYKINYNLNWDTLPEQYRDDPTWQSDYRQTINPVMVGISADQSDVPGQSIINSFNPLAAPARRRLLTPDEELHLSDMLYYSSPASQDADPSRRNLDQVLFVDSFKIAADGTTVSQSMVYVDDGTGNAANNGQGMTEFLDNAQNDPTAMASAMQAQGFSGEIGGVSVGFPTVTGVETEGAEPTPAKKKKTNSVAIGAGVGAGVGGAVLIAAIVAAVAMSKKKG